MTDEEEDRYYKMIAELRRVEVDANYIGQQIDAYDMLDPEEFFHGKERRKNAEIWGNTWMLGENVDEFVNIIIKLLKENMIFDKEGKEYAWDTVENDYIETDESIEEEILISEPTIPEMYAQNFMNAGGNGPVNV